MQKIIVLFLLFTGFFTYNENNDIILSSELTMKEIKNHKMSNYVNNQTSSKTLDVALASNEYKEEFLEAYKKIAYVETENFIKEINAFLKKKYLPDEINNIYKNLRLDNIPKLLNKDYLNLSDFFAIKNFDVDNYARYITWSGDKDFDLATIVTYVNIGLDKEFYSFYEEIKNPEDYTVLVNKFHKLSSEYVPNDLVSLKFEERFKLRSSAAIAFEQMIEVALKDGSHIVPFSAYRSYEYQQGLYEAYALVDGYVAADTYSARPGHSEHQTGLAVDAKSITEEKALNEKDYEWVENNAHKFGFILRYPKDGIDITGYKHEPWHLRYVGIEIATNMKELNITYDEYYDLYLK